MATDTYVDEELPEGEEVEVPEGEETEVSTEDRARAMGWKPKEEFRGNPRHWRPAEEYIETGERELPILRDNNKRMAERLARMEPEITSLKASAAEMKQAVQDSLILARRSEERGYQRALEEAKAARREAVQAGDVDTVEALDARIDDIRTKQEEAKPRPVEPAKPAVDPAIDAFRSENPWFDTDQVLNRSMIAMHTIVMGKFPNLTLAGQLQEALKRVKAEYPERFDDYEEDEVPTPPVRATLRAPSAAPVARPSGTVRAPRQVSGWETIPEGEREACKAAYARQKRSMPDFTEAEYIALYSNPHADVLELQRQKRLARK